ncbi:hypothetical protein PCOAH_00047830 [Plasmodium coatneyi]|uniref:PIR Superfamily Protein n=1 Tax=Plasmodium coatneyi TaxID=208452 RepID=A0A1B1E5Z6_9APIC|nr:hypothetical protein PCOAH_00047830 [Plasmodium coatneyi]ANQ10446.1 hypothetical protein PCOAH_00047830 [Plasmodium coatneyi]
MVVVLDYSNYLEQIKTSYLTMHSHYGQRTRNTFCNEFGEEFQNGNISELDKLKCTVVPTRQHGERTATSGSSPSEGSNSATNNITPIVSSILGVATLPITTFFLYKYDLLPSWFRKQLKGRSRRKRSLERNLDYVLLSHIILLQHRCLTEGAEEEQTSEKDRIKEKMYPINVSPSSHD